MRLTPVSAHDGGSGCPRDGQLPGSVDRLRDGCPWRFSNRVYQECTVTAPEMCMAARASSRPSNPVRIVVGMRNNRRLLAAETD